MFILFYLGFIFSLFLAFYIPGRVVLGKKTSIPSFDRFILSIIVGIVMWAVQGFLFGYLHARFLTYGYLLVFIILYVKNGLSDIESLKKIRTRLLRRSFLTSRKDARKWDFISLFLILAGTVAQNINYFFIGSQTSQGIRLAAINNQDHIWQISLTGELVKNFPPNEPGMFGIPLTNYHYLFNLVTADLIRIFHLPLFQTQFMGMYVLGSLLIGAVAYILAQKIFPNKSFVRWMLVFLYFGGDITYLFTYGVTKQFQFTVPTLIDRGILFMDNPPRAFSHIIALAILYFLYRYIKNEHSKQEIAVLIVLFGMLIGFKVYTGAVLLGALFFLLFFHASKKRFTTFLLFCCSCLITLAIFLPVNAHSGGVIFLPFERPRDFLTYVPLGFTDWQLRWQIYQAHHSYFRIIQYGVMMTVLYLVMQWGTKIIGFLPLRSTFKVLKTELVIFLYSGIFISIITATFFAQKVNIGEGYNFYFPASLFLVIIASLNLSNLGKKLPTLLKYIFIVLILGLTLPRFFYELNTTVSAQIHPKIVIGQELASYNFVKNNIPQNSLVLVENKGTFDYTSSLIRVMTNQNMFLSGQIVASLHGVTNAYRTAVVNTLATSSDPAKINTMLHTNNINYIYLYAPNSIKANISQLDIKKVFDNGFSQIYKVE